MKSRSLSIATALLVMAFAFSSVIVAQNKDSKQTENKVTTTIQKTDTKTGDKHQVAGTVQQNTKKTETNTGIKSTETTKTDVKKTDTETKQHHKMPITKNEVKKTETKKK
jgi:hypothetical protein